MTATLEGKVAIVTGAGRGIGRGIALAFAHAGAKVAVASRTASTVDSVVAEIRAGGGEALPVCTDIGDKAAIDHMVEATAAAFGGLDILVNNAQGHGSRASPAPTPVLQPLETFDESHWDFALETGPLATLRAMKAAFPHLEARGGGRIINFGSRWGQLGMEGSVAYNAAKEAIRALSRTAAREWGQHGITVNVINPTIVTDAYQFHAAQHPEEVARDVAMIPLRRAGEPLKDLGPVAVFLASDGAGYLTGMTVMVDGGKYMTP
ncbi:MAG: SDR family oxidoreductase [Sphingomonadaceae bacterium]|nr:SDR family oxidoreductase [Sphingomonadaceae bacterium]